MTEHQTTVSTEPDIVERLLAPGHGALADEAAHEIERLRAALDILQAAMVAVNPIPMRHKRAINQARAKLRGAA